MVVNQPLSDGGIVVHDWLPRLPGRPRIQKSSEMAVVAGSMAVTTKCASLSIIQVLGFGIASCLGRYLDIPTA